MKIKEIRDLSTDDINQKKNDLKKQLYALNYDRKVGRVEKPHMFSLIKKDIARINTILNERKRKK
ncbi:MAG: 50S ribosomal protein L29 [Candidatus Omnitrophica bacterium]|nr:50S ribosomal protein L29 [Candidatus Omnitrophota bacterium]HOX54724.1 50S ribosomal protein L29 [Candidatus Omnitrophota bacterium]